MHISTYLTMFLVMLSVMVSALETQKGFIVKYILTKDRRPHGVVIGFEGGNIKIISLGRSTIGYENNNEFINRLGKNALGKALYFVPKENLLGVVGQFTNIAELDAKVKELLDTGVRYRSVPDQGSQGTGLHASTAPNHPPSETHQNRNLPVPQNPSPRAGQSHQSPFTPPNHPQRQPSPNTPQTHQNYASTMDPTRNLPPLPQNRLPSYRTTDLQQYHLAHPGTEQHPQYHHDPQTRRNQNLPGLPPNRQHW